MNVCRLKSPLVRPRAVLNVAKARRRLAAASSCAALLAVFATPAMAQDSAEPQAAPTSTADPVEIPAPPPPPACATQAAPYRDFDFWVGTWRVVDANPEAETPTVYGRNVISKREGGCLLVEEWTGAQGSSGLSMNFVDPDTGKWRQVWMNTGVFIDYAGEREGDQMRLEGEIVYNPSTSAAEGQEPAARFPFRGSWTLRDNGDVLQEFWQFNPQSEEWDVWFAGLYQPEAPPASETPPSEPQPLNSQLSDSGAD